MTIRTKLFAGYAAMSAIVAAVGVSGLVLNRAMQADMAFITKHAYASVHTASEAQAVAQALDTRIERLIAVTIGPRQPGESISVVDARVLESDALEGVVRLRQALGEARRPFAARATESPAGAAATSVVLGTVDTLITTVDHLERDLRRLMSPQMTSAPLAVRAEAAARIRTELTTRIVAPIRTLSHDAKNDMAEGMIEVEEANRASLRIEVLAIIASLVVTGLLAFVVGRSIIGSIETLLAAAGRIGAGDPDEPDCASDEGRGRPLTASSRRV